VAKGTIKTPQLNGSTSESAAVAGDMELDTPLEAAPKPRKRIVRRGAASDEPAVAVETESAMPMLASACPGMALDNRYLHGYAW